MRTVSVCSRPARFTDDWSKTWRSGCWPPAMCRTIRTIGDFRKRHLTALQGFFEQVLRLARELGAPRVGRVALDGTKIKANASKHKAMSYGRMPEKQRQLREEVRQLLAQADAADAAEDARVRAGSAGRRIAGGIATAREPSGADPRGQAGARRRGQKPRPPPRASRRTRRNRSRSRNTTSPIRSRGS